MGFGIEDSVRQADSVNKKMQIVVICGNNRKALRKLSKLSFRHEVRLLGYVNNVELYMDAADLIVTKAGGITISEAIAKQLPMIIEHPIPGQEMRNTEFMLNYGMAMAASSTMPLSEAIYYAMEPNRTCMMRQAMAAFGKRDAAERTAEVLIDL